MPSKYQSLLNDKDVKRWYENVARGSPIAADVQLRRLGNFCASRKVTPKDLVRLEETQLCNLLLDTVGQMERKGFAGAYIGNVLKAQKSWFLFNGKDVKRTIRIRGLNETPTLQNE